MAGNRRTDAARDENEPEIVGALRALGATVARDLPVDLLVGYRGHNFLMEVKKPLGPRGGDPSEFTPLQERLIAGGEWAGRPIEVVRDIGDAVRALGAKVAGGRHPSAKPPGPPTARERARAWRRSFPPAPIVGTSDIVLNLDDIEARVEREITEAEGVLEARLEELRGHAAVLAGAFERGTFVRSTEGDEDPGWAVRLLPDLSALAALTKFAEEPLEQEVPPSRASLVRAFVGFVWELCDEMSGSVTGGCRSAKRNAGVGGNPKSKHTFGGGWGMACDVVLDDPKVRQAAVKRVQEAGYHPVVKDSYAPGQIHIQGWAFGETPSLEIEEDRRR